MDEALTIRVDDADDRGALASLLSWLRAEAGPYGRVGTVGAPPPPGTLGTVADVLTVAVGAGGTDGTDVMRWHPAPASVLTDTGAFGVFTEDGRVLAWESDTDYPADRTLRLWRTSGAYSAHPAGTLTVANGGVVHAVSDHALLAFSDVGLPQLWDLADPRHPRAAPPIDVGGRSVLEAVGPGVLALGMSASADLNPRTIRLWDLNDPQHPAHGELPKAVVHDLAVGHDGRTLAVATDKAIELWEIADIHHPVKVRSLAVERHYTVAFSRDDRLLVSVSGTVRKSDPDLGQVHLWQVGNPRTADRLGTFTVPRSVAHVGFDPDGSSLLVNDVTADGVKSRVYLVDTDIDRITRRLCAAVGGTITREQWEQYLPGTPYQPPCR
ncbi:hypothetical protein ACIQOW_38545 [Kitasatospora sp. NPDC091335]|uniref:effector-associated constant component EACC1 n=1 Tax=Kitasatospora sp. NPDC091335 TaxID=3364085 RepID=UPI0038057D0A